MKTEWQFPFDVSGFRFDAERRFGAVARRDASSLRDPRDFQFEVRICPENSEPSPGFDQSGFIFIVLPMAGEEANAAAHQLVHMLAEKLSFQWGHFKIHGGFVMSKRIPETPEEETEVGDTPYSLTMHVVEVIDPPVFDVKAFAAASARPMDLRLLAQYNEACREKSVIGQFLGLFRIVENRAISESPKLTLKDAIKASTQLRAMFLESVKGVEFDTFVDSIVETRHECAHLRLEKNFGYVPIDPRLESEVRPLLFQLQILARSCVEDT